MASRVRLAFVLALALVGCGAQDGKPAGSPSPIVDGLAIGEPRSTDLFPKLESAVRDAWHANHTTSISSFGTHHAGVLADGTTQPGTESELVFLGVFEIPGGARHAVVIQCPLLAVTAAGTCEVTGPIP